MANLVDQIRIIQQHYVYNFQKQEDIAEILIQRIDSFKDIDLNLLAESNTDNFYHPKLNTVNLSKKSSMTSSLASGKKYQHGSSSQDNSILSIKKA